MQIITMAFLLKNAARKYLSPHTFRNYCRFNKAQLPIVYSEDVLRAKAEGKPIVALESTIITHGMPYPQNVETAKEVENIIRQRVSRKFIFSTS